MAGPDWLWGFMQRHPELSIWKPDATNIARAVGFNQVQFATFFKAYKELQTAHPYTVTKIWNIDETGIINIQKPVKIVASKGAKVVDWMTSGERGKTVTVVCTMSASGSYIPPMFIFPRQRMVDTLMKDDPAGSIETCTTSGWIDGECFVKWLQHFTSMTKPSPEDKHLIILDGHHSHKTLESISHAKVHGIELIILPIIVPTICSHQIRPFSRFWWMHIMWLRITGWSLTKEKEFPFML